MSREISFRTLISYSLPALPLALFAVTFYVYIPKFYADVIGVPVATIGTIVLISRIWDALIDPAMGFISDHSKFSWGRRLPWIAIASPLLLFSFVLLLIPELNQTSLSSAAWLGVWTFVFFLFWTMVSVPYEALGPELSFSYGERNKLFGWREGCLVLGTLLAAVFPYLLESHYPELTEKERFAFLAYCYSAAYFLIFLLLLALVREKKWQSAQRPTEKFLASVSHVLQNSPFRILLSAYTIAAFGGALPATLILFYVESVLKSNQGSAFLVLYFAVGFVCLPFWIWLANKIGKKEAWIAAMLINTGSFSAVFFLGAGDIKIYGILVSLSAIGYGATLALPSSMQADVIDYDEWKHRTRKEGQFISFWSIAKKLSAALGAGIGLWVLGLAGYQTALSEQPDSAILALRSLYAAVPSTCSFIAIVIAWKYPIDEAFHRKIREEIDRL